MYMGLVDLLLRIANSSSERYQPATSQINIFEYNKVISDQKTIKYLYKRQLINNKGLRFEISRIQVRFTIKFHLFIAVVV